MWVIGEWEIKFCEEENLITGRKNEIQEVKPVFVLSWFSWWMQTFGQFFREWAVKERNKCPMEREGEMSHETNECHHWIWYSLLIDEDSMIHNSDYHHYWVLLNPKVVAFDGIHEILRSLILFLSFPNCSPQIMDLENWLRGCLLWTNYSKMASFMFLWTLLWFLIHPWCSLIRNMPPDIDTDNQESLINAFIYKAKLINSLSKWFQ